MTDETYIGRHRRCRYELWCGGERCVLAVQHANDHVLPSDGPQRVFGGRS